MQVIYFILTSFILFFSSLNSSLGKDEALTDSISSPKHLVGQINKSSLLQLPHRAWFERNYTTYFPDLATIKKLKTTLNGIQVKAFMGTWCHDSQREVPRFYKVLESSDFDLANLELVSLNLEKKTSDGLEEGLNIQRTPTFIFFKNGVEIGRIVETPRVSLESDLLKIVLGKNYKHSYQ